jgi:hypothetical protein
MTKLFRHEHNFIKYVATHPCADPYFVFIETFIECVPDLVADLIWFLDAGNVGEAAAREVMPGKVGKRRGHLRLQKAVEKGETNLQKKALFWLKGAMWIMGPLDAIGSFLLVYAAMDRLFYRWHSLLIERNYCNWSPNTGPLQMQLDDQTVLYTAPGNTPALTSIRQNRAGWHTTPFGFSVPSGFYDAILTVTSAPNDGIDRAECWVELDATTAVGHFKKQSDHAEIAGTGETTFSVHLDFASAPIVGSEVTFRLFSVAPIVQGQHTTIRLIGFSRPFFTQ